MTELFYLPWRLDAPAPTWRKSSRSGGGAGSMCVEFAFVGDEVAVRHSRDTDGPYLLFTMPEWVAFVGGVKDGEFDLPHEGA